MKKFFWDGVHHLIAHPLLFISQYSQWSVRFHDYTKVKSSPDKQVVYEEGYTMLLEKVSRRNRKNTQSEENSSEQ